MRSDITDRVMRAVAVTVGSLGMAVIVALAGCATPPPAPVRVPAQAPTLAEKIGGSLRAMSFEERDDGWYLSLPAPLIFQFDSDIVAADARENLIRIAAELRSSGIERVNVHGHTDIVGTRKYNLALSKRRADAVARVLSEGGYPPDGIDAKGMGSTVPVADNTTSEGRGKNRRVVIIVQVAVAIP